MSKTLSIILINALLIIALGFLPLYILFTYHDSYANVNILQNIVFLVLLCSSCILVYINNKAGKELNNYKWIYVFFMIVGFAGLTYSLISFSLIYLFRHGIGL